MIVVSFGNMPTKQTNGQTLSSTINIEFTDSSVTKKEKKAVDNVNVRENFTSPIIPVDEQQKTQSAETKSHRGAIRIKTRSYQEQL